MTDQNTFTIAELQQKANDGDAQAQFDLALCYANGTGIEKNEGLAFEWHKKAAEQGHVNAQFALGLYYFLGHAERQTNTLISKWFNDKFININVDSAFDLAVSQVLSRKLISVNDDLAFVWLKNAVEQNHTGANYWLGICYRDGIGTKPNDELAFESFKIAAEQGIAESQYSLACCYFTGKGIEKSGELGLQWCEKAAEQNHVDAQYRLSQYYFDGEGTEQKAISWLKRAAEQGMDEAEIQLADCYAQGNGIEKDDVQAIHWYTKAAEKGDKEAQYWIAECYEKGECIEQSYKRAFDWYEEAAKQGHLKAKKWLDEQNLKLSSMDINDESLTQNEELAFVWLSKAAEKGDAEAQFRLAECCFNGNQSLSLKSSIEWYEKAAKQGHAEAKKFLAGYYLMKATDHLSGKEENNQSDKLGFEWMKKAAELGFAPTQYLLGLAYESGIGTEQNSKLAFVYFKKAAEAAQIEGNREVGELANYRLGNLYQTGEGCERDYELARQKYMEGILAATPKSSVARKILPIKLAIHNSIGDFDSSEEFVEDFSENAEDSDKELIEICKTNIKQARDLRKITQELEEKNKELNNLVAMFAHNFLGTLQCIRSNAEHDNNPNIHLKTVKMMGGALTAFSILSADNDKLVEQLKQDNTGETSLQQSLANNLALAISQLLGKTNKDKIVNLYLHHLRKTQQIECDTTSEELRANRDYRKKWQALQHQWEDGFNVLFSEKADLPVLQKWITDNFFPVEIIGFDSCNISFKEYGITDSIFLIVFMEIFVNAFKYMDVSKNEPLTLKLCEEDQCYKLVCENPSSQETGRGTHKGMDFLKTIAKKLGGQFITEVTGNSFKSTFVIPSELLK